LVAFSEIDVTLSTSAKFVQSTSVNVQVGFFYRMLENFSARFNRISDIMRSTYPGGSRSVPTTLISRFRSTISLGCYGKWVALKKPFGTKNLRYAFESFAAADLRGSAIPYHRSTRPRTTDGS